MSGAPVGNRPACPGSGPCQAACDGQHRTGCAFPGSEVSCGNSTCADGWQTTSACGGNGTCHPTTTSCGLFVCDAAGIACLTTCSADADCVGAAFCLDGVCQGDEGLGESCASPDQCLSGYCVDGVCCDTTCDGACKACNVPGYLGFCTEEADGSSCDGGTCCDGDCVDLQSDPAHCGACDAACRAEACRAPVCVAGTCEAVGAPVPDGAPCAGGGLCCSGACVDHLNDPANCGGCGIICGADQACLGGGCGPCGDEFDPCCPPNSTCLEGSRLFCNASGFCQACGLADNLCCPPDDTCAVGICTDGFCPNCGLNGDPCCPPDNTCRTLRFCDADGICQVCGTLGNPCCPPGNTCIGELICTDVTCQ